MENKEPGRGLGMASLAVGIVSVVFCFYGYSAIISIIAGLVGMILAGTAKKQGFSGGIQSAGFVLSLIGLIGGTVVFVSCVACTGCLLRAGLNL